MAKKFEIAEDNPIAMMYIDRGKESSPAHERGDERGQGVPKGKPAPARLPSKKKPAPAEQQSKTPAPAPAGYKINPMYIETKTKRVQLVFKPSLLERVKAAAAEQGISLNEFIHRVLEKELSED